MNIIRTCLAGLFLLGIAVAADAATLTVCASGCTYTNAQLQTALQSAEPGDTVLLQEGFIYAGKFILTEKTCVADDVTCTRELRAGVSATGTVLSTSLFPAEDMRVCVMNMDVDPPVRVCHSSVEARFSKFQTNENNKPSLRTVQPGETGANCVAVPCIAKWWKLKWLEFIPNSYGGDALVHLGSNINTGLGIAGDDLQNLKSEIPSEIILEQVVLRGDPITGQKRGLFMAANGVTVQDSAFYDFKSLSEGQAILCGNTAGDFTVTNNLIEGNGENFMCGGDGQRASQTVTVAASPAPTTTTATLSAVTDLSVGQWVTMLVGAVAQRTQITAITSLDVTFTTHPLTAAPDVPGSVKWSLVPSGGTISKNHFYKPLAWRNPVLEPPPAPTVTCATTGGTLAAGTYGYVVAARLLAANGGTLTSKKSNEGTGTVTSGTTGSCVVTWTEVATASSYRVHGRTVGAQERYWGLSTLTYTDTGLSGSLGAAPNSGSVWQVKNIFELKNYDTLLIEGNIFENVWTQAQVGYAIVLTPTAQSGVSSVVKNITFRKNIVRNASGFMQVTACSAVSGELTGHSANLVVTDNLVYNVGNAFGSKLRSIDIRRGCSIDALPLGLATLTIKHNTISHDSNYPNTDSNGNISVLFDFWKNPVQDTISNFTFTDNMMRALDYGIIGSEDASGSIGVEGETSWNNITGSGTNSLTKNLFAGATCSRYPGTNYCPSVTSWWDEFVDYAAGDFRLKPGSTYKLLGTDSLDLGADILALEALTDIALSGDNGGSVTVPPLVITTTSLPDGTEGVAYSASIIATGGTAPVTFTVVAGSGALPTNYSLSTAGAITGTMALASISSNTTYNFTARATDSAGTPVTADQALSIFVADVSALVVVTQGPLTPAVFGQAYSFQLVASGGGGSYTWSTCDATTLPDGLAISSGGVITWTPISFDTAAFCASVTDATSVVTADLEIRVPGRTQLEERRLAAVDGRAIDMPTCLLGTQRHHYNTTTLDWDCVPAGGTTTVHFFSGAATSGQAWANQPQAETEAYGSTSKRFWYDATAFSSVRLSLRVIDVSASANSPKCYLRFTTDESAWTTIATDVSLATAGTIKSDFIDLPAAARADVIWGVWCSGGDGVADPGFGVATMQLRY